MSPAPIDPDRLFRLRLAVARYGEMDKAHWWNSNSVLGHNGGLVYPRGFPATSWFVRARVVFAIAARRCTEWFDPPGCATLWQLPQPIEEAQEGRWQEWLDAPERFLPFFESLVPPPPCDLHTWLGSLGLLGGAAIPLLTLRRSAPDSRGVQLPGTPILDEGTITLLAAGFSLGSHRSLVVPYARVDA